MKRSLILVLSILIWGCSSEDSEYFAFEAPELEISKQLHFGDDDELLLGNINNVHLDKKGRFYVPDNDNHTIFVFGEDGEFLSKIGRQGRGPGEFERISLTISENDDLFVYDWNQRRVQIFQEVSDLNWIVIQEFMIEQTGRYFPIAVFPIHSNNFLVQYTTGMSRDNSEELLPYFGIQGSEIEEEVFLFSFKNAEYAIQTSGNSMTAWWHPFGTDSQNIVRNNTIYHAWTGELRILRSTIQEDFSIVTDTLVNYELAPIPLSSAELNEAIINYSDDGKREIRNLGIETKPQMRSLIVDDQQNIWVKRFVESGEHNWFIFNSNGELTHSLYLSDDFTPRVIQNSLITGIYRTDDILPYIAVYRIEP